MEKLKEFIKKEVLNNIESKQAHMTYYEEEFAEMDFDDYFASFGWYSTFDLTEYDNELVYDLIKQELKNSDYVEFDEKLNNFKIYNKESKINEKNQNVGIAR